MGQHEEAVVGFIAGVTAPPGKRGHAGALTGGADTADAKQVMEACGIRTTRNPSEMGKLLVGAVSHLQSRRKPPGGFFSFVRRMKGALPRETSPFKPRSPKHTES